MCNDDFGEVYTGLTERLDMFFHKNIRGAGITQNIEDIKLELLQTTAMVVLEKLQKEMYNDYSLPALIWVKAKDTWANYIVMRKRAALVTFPPEGEIELVPMNVDPFAAFEQAQLLNTLQNLNDVSSWDMFALHTEGYLYKEIAQYFNTTEASVKMKISRLRSKTGQHRTY